MRERYHCTPGTNVWHATRRCSRDPRLDYWSRSKVPVGGELCGECRHWQADGRPSSPDTARPGA